MPGSKPDACTTGSPGSAASASASIQRLPAALAGAGHSLQEASYRTLNARLSYSLAHANCPSASAPRRFFVRYTILCLADPLFSGAHTRRKFYREDPPSLILLVELRDRGARLGHAQRSHSRHSGGWFVPNSDWRLGASPSMKYALRRHLRQL